MSITPGTHLGRYDIRSQLGAGGMGASHLDAPATCEFKGETPPTMQLT